MTSSIWKSGGPIHKCYNVAINKYREQIEGIVAKEILQ